jgi:hypothetical protein
MLYHIVKMQQTINKLDAKVVRLQGMLHVEFDDDDDEQCNTLSDERLNDKLEDEACRKHTVRF